MTKLVFVLVLVLGGAMWVGAQTGGGETGGPPADSAQPQNPNSQDAGGAVPAATGIDVTTEMSENPPVTGMDEPKLERVFMEHSYLAPRAEVSQGIDSNFPGIFTNARAAEVTRVLGAADLEKMWKVHPFDLKYIGGLAAFHGPGGSHVYLVQSLAATQRFRWSTGQLALRDSFSYLPEGSFGFNSYGGEGGYGIGTGLGGLGGGGGITGSQGTSFGNALFGSIGYQPRIANMAVVDVTQYLSPRSSVVLAGGYGLTDFLGTVQPSVLCGQSSQCFLNSNQTLAQAGYNYQISRRNQIGLSYAYAEFHFPGITAGSINANVWQLVFGHRISGKLNFVLGGGPELVRTHETIPVTVAGIVTVPVTLDGSFLSGSARASLVYKASGRTSLTASYVRAINAGSGLFGGASTDSVRLSVNHALTRTWNTLLGGGYSRSSRLLAASSGVAGNARSYEFAYASGTLRHQMGRELGLFISYQYNSFNFGSGYCVSGRCPNSYGRQVALIGFDWTPRPLRLD